MFGLLVITTVFVRTMLSLAKDPAIRSLVFAAAGAVALGTAFYAVAESWSITDALYFSVVSLTTVGYGDLNPTTTAAKMFTVMYLIIGVGLLMGFINAAASLRIEQRRKARLSLEARKNGGQPLAAGPAVRRRSFRQSQRPSQNAHARPRSARTASPARSASRSRRTSARL